MSHFVVGVITKTGEDNIEDLLAPYNENSTNLPFEWRSWHDYKEDEYYLNQYENGTIPFQVEESEDSHIHLVERHNWTDRDLKIVDVPTKNVYHTYEEYLREYVGAEYVDGKGYGYWYNDNAKWDWYVIGGRWDGYFDGENTINVKDYDTAIDKEYYNKKLQEWKDWESGKEFDFSESYDFAFYKPEYLKGLYGSAENYARIKSTPWMRAIVTPDGEWHEVGEMGWWGCSDETHEDLMDWVDNFVERFILPYSNGEYEITAVDCHI